MVVFLQWLCAVLALLVVPACFTGVRLALTYPDLSRNSRLLLLRMAGVLGLLAITAVVLELVFWLDKVWMWIAGGAAAVALLVVAVTLVARGWPLPRPAAPALNAGMGAPVPSPPQTTPPH